MHTRRRTVALVALLLLAGCVSATAPPDAVLPVRAVAAPDQSVAAARTPRPAHVVIVVFENRSASDVLGNARAPYLTALARRGATMTRSYALTHPSQPNYFALFSGSYQGDPGDRCPVSVRGRANLGSLLRRADHSFAGYSEGLPYRGFTGCHSHDRTYVRRHSPWVSFTNVRRTANLPYSRFPSDYRRLPRVSFVIPDICNDMHDCSVRTGDTWARRNLDRYARWAETHRSLLIVTFDEDDRSSANRIPTFLVGQYVHRGRYSQRINHYSVLRTVCDMFGIRPPGHAARVAPISRVWTS
jgi:acid phosphatase